MADLLLVVDVQNGFINEKCKHVIPEIKKLVSMFTEAGKLVAFTRFINHTGSEYERFIKWFRLKEEPEINIVEELKEDVINVFDKTHYTPFIPGFVNFLHSNNIDRVFICGIATDSCVMKSAIDCFEHGFEPIVAKDAVYSHAGEEAHQAGLLVISRNIGRNQLKDFESIVGELHKQV